eukprot:520523-Rhodomonas_salina.3
MAHPIRLRIPHLLGVPAAGEASHRRQFARSWKPAADGNLVSLRAQGIIQGQIIDAFAEMRTESNQVSQVALARSWCSHAMKLRKMFGSDERKECHVHALIGAALRVWAGERRFGAEVLHFELGAIRLR